MNVNILAFVPLQQGWAIGSPWSTCPCLPFCSPWCTPKYTSSWWCIVLKNLEIGALSIPQASNIISEFKKNTGKTAWLHWVVRHISEAINQQSMAYSRNKNPDVGLGIQIMSNFWNKGYQSKPDELILLNLDYQTS